MLIFYHLDISDEVVRDLTKWVQDGTISEKGMRNGRAGEIRGPSYCVSKVVHGSQSREIDHGTSPVNNLGMCGHFWTSPLDRQNKLKYYQEYATSLYFRVKRNKYPHIHIYSHVIPPSFRAKHPSPLTIDLHIQHRSIPSVYMQYPTLNHHQT